MAREQYISPQSFILYRETGVVATIPTPPTLRKSHADFTDENLEIGEWAKNVVDGKLFYRSSAGIEEFTDDLFDLRYVLAGPSPDPIDISDWFEIVNPGDTDEYLRCKKPFAGDYEIQAWSDSGQVPPTIWEAMPYATSTTVGGIKVGANLTIDINGVLNASGGAVGSIDWGPIGGDIEDQVDLMAMFALKAPIADPTFTTKITTPYIVGNSTGNRLGIFTSTPDDDVHLRVDRNGATYLKVSNEIATGNVNALAGVILFSSTSAGTLQIYPSDYTVAAFQDRIGLTANSSCSNGLYIRTTANSPIDFYTYAAYLAPTMRLTGGGYLGINEPAPDERLEVNGNIHCTGNIYAEGEISAFASGDPGPDLWDYMPIATNSTVGGFILWDTQFTLVGGVLKIKDSVITPAAHTHDDRYFTEAETNSAISQAIANLVDTSPATLDTLNELAAALGDDPNFATTVANAIGLKAPINNPTFTGTVAGITYTMVGAAAVAQTFYLGTTQIAINRGSGSISLTGITSIDGTAASTPKLLTTNFSIEESGGKLIIKYGAATIGSISSAGYLKMKDESEAFVASP